MSVLGNISEWKNRWDSFPGGGFEYFDFQRRTLKDWWSNLTNLWKQATVASFSLRFNATWAHGIRKHRRQYRIGFQVVLNPKMDVRNNLGACIFSEKKNMGIDTSFHFIWRSWNGSPSFFGVSNFMLFIVRWVWGIAHWMRYLSLWFIMTPGQYILAMEFEWIWCEMNMEYGNFHVFSLALSIATGQLFFVRKAIW